MTDKSSIAKKTIQAAPAPTDPFAEDPAFVHAVLAQVGLPRDRVEGRTFTRTNGAASMMIEAGRMFQNGRFVDLPLPFGTKPRLALIYVSTEAVRTKSPDIDIGSSTRDFLRRIGINESGREMARFKSQMTALARSRLLLGYSRDGADITVECGITSRFEAWTAHNDDEPGFWPGHLVLTAEFFESLREYAVPLKPSALRHLQTSSLALDIYSWLAHRLCRVRSNAGTRLSWENLRGQFGGEYSSTKRFREKFLIALRRVREAYPEARVDDVRGGLLLKASPPPIKRTSVVVALPAPAPAPKPEPKAAVAPKFITEEALDKLRTVAPGWDRQWLLAKYQAWSSGKPAADNPDAAFLAWARKFTKGKAP